MSSHGTPYSNLRSPLASSDSVVWNERIATRLPARSAGEVHGRIRAHEEQPGAEQPARKHRHAGDRQVAIDRHQVGRHRELGDVELALQHAAVAVLAVARRMRLPDLKDLQRDAVARLHGAVEERKVPVVAFERDADFHAAFPFRGAQAALVGRKGQSRHRAPRVAIAACLVCSSRREASIGWRRCP